MKGKYIILLIIFISFLLQGCMWDDLGFSSDKDNTDANEQQMNYKTYFDLTGATTTYGPYGAVKYDLSEKTSVNGTIIIDKTINYIYLTGQENCVYNINLIISASDVPLNITLDTITITGNDTVRYATIYSAERDLIILSINKSNKIEAKNDTVSISAVGCKVELSGNTPLCITGGNGTNGINGNDGKSATDYNENGGNGTDGSNGKDGCCAVESEVLILNALSTISFYGGNGGAGGNGGNGGNGATGYAGTIRDHNALSGGGFLTGGGNGTDGGNGGNGGNGGCGCKAIISNNIVESGALSYFYFNGTYGAAGSGGKGGNGGNGGNAGNYTDTSMLGGVDLEGYGGNGGNGGSGGNGGNGSTAGLLGLGGNEGEGGYGQYLEWSQVYVNKIYDNKLTRRGTNGVAGPNGTNGEVLFDYKQD